MPPDNNPFSVGKSLNIGLYDLQFAQHADDLIARAESEGKVLSVVQYKGRDVLRVSNKKNSLVEAIRRLTGFYTTNARNVQNYRTSLPSHTEHRHQESAKHFAQAIHDKADAAIQRHPDNHPTLAEAKQAEGEVKPTPLPAETFLEQTIPQTEAQAKEELPDQQPDETTQEATQVTVQEAPALAGQSVVAAKPLDQQESKEIVKLADEPPMDPMVQNALEEPLPAVEAQAKETSAAPLPDDVPEEATQATAQEISKVLSEPARTPEPEIVQPAQEKIILVNDSLAAPTAEAPKKVAAEPTASTLAEPAEELWDAAALYMFKSDLKEALEAYLNQSSNLGPKELQMIKGTIGQLQSPNPNLYTIKVRLNLIADLAKENGLLSHFHFPEDKVRPAVNKPKITTPELDSLVPNADVAAENFSKRAQALKDMFGRQAYPDFIKLVIEYRNREIPKGNPFAMAVSDAELFALMRYGGGFYKQVNALLRNDHNAYYEKSSEAIAVALNASSALQKLEKAGIINRSLVHRGIHNYKGFVDKKEGDTFKEEGLMSTSRSTQVLDMFARFTDDAKTDPTVFRMFTKGVPLDPKAGFIEKEEEVLLAPNSEHKILFKGQRPAFDSNGQFLKDVTEIVTEQIGVDPHQGHSESNQWIIDAVLKGFDDLENRTRTRNPADPRLVKDDGDI